MSSTKPILGVAAMIAIEQGLFKASDPIEKYIPEFKGAKVAVPDGSKTGHKLVDAERPPTIHDLLPRTSGFAGFTKVKKTGYEKESVLNHLALAHGHHPGFHGLLPGRHDKSNNPVNL